MSIIRTLHILGKGVRIGGYCSEKVGLQEHKFWNPTPKISIFELEKEKYKNK